MIQTSSFQRPLCGLLIAGLWAEAVAIRDGRIVFVGTDKDLRACIGIATGGWSRSPISSACVRNIRRAMSLQEPSRSSRTV
jgi:hypothetical protein